MDKSMTQKINEIGENTIVRLGFMISTIALLVSLTYFSTNTLNRIENSIENINKKITQIEQRQDLAEKEYLKRIEFELYLEKMKNRNRTLDLPEFNSKEK